MRALMATSAIIGRMEYEKDYVIADDNITVTILIKPIKDEIVEFFYYV